MSINNHSSNKKDSLDKIKINDLSIPCIIGTEAYEREDKQQVILNLTLFVDLEAAGKNDELSKTVDYSKLSKEIYEMVVETKLHLIETLAHRVADMVLNHNRVKKAIVSIKKPSALPLAKSTEVQIVREKS